MTKAGAFALLDYIIVNGMSATLDVPAPGCGVERIATTPERRTASSHRYCGKPADPQYPSRSRLDR